jgi:hypothetical protein
MKDLVRWPNLKLSDFRIASDFTGKIRGFAALYDGREFQKFVPRAYHGFANTVQQLLRVASFSGLVRPLPSPGHEIPLRFLSHVVSDNAEIFHRLVDDAFSRIGSKELLSYAHFRGNWRTLPPNAFFATSLPYGLYLLLPPHSDAPPWPIPSVRSLPPEFEAAWL